MTKERVRSQLKPAETNLTSMIDVVFLLISFFTLVMNFSQAEQNEEVALPKSELAQPPEASPPEQITIQVLADRTISLGNVACSIDESSDLNATSFAEVLREELRILNVVRRVQPQDVTIIVRADENAETGFVQRVISACQQQKLDSFVLRARQDRGL